MNSILSILSILSVIAGLWIAGKLLPDLIAWFYSAYRNDLLFRPLIKILLWLGLGAFFTLPLLDFASWLGNLMNFALVPQGEFSTMLGTVSMRVYSIFLLLLMLAVYGIIVYFARDYMKTGGHFNQAERIFIVLSIASLVYRGVHSIFIQIFTFQLPIINVTQNLGITGFFIEVLVGIAILTVTLIILNKVLPTHPARSG
jgi:hypothetical protein